MHSIESLISLVYVLDKSLRGRVRWDQNARSRTWEMMILILWSMNIFDSSVIVLAVSMLQCLADAVVVFNQAAGTGACILPNIS